MNDTAKLSLPYIMPSQAQKHVTHNEALRRLDAVVQLSVLSRTADSPPAEPAEGDRYLTTATPGGAWEGHSEAVAAFQDGAWAFYTAQAGWLVWVEDEALLLAHDGVSFVEAAVRSVNPVAMVGVNTTADATNRLAAAAPATLLTHEGAGHQLKINKAAPGDTGSLLFQTNWSGRAEMGLSGDDDFHVKVSADGAIWFEAITIDRNTGSVSLPATEIAAGIDDGQVQFRIEGALAADTHFTFDPAQRFLGVGVHAPAATLHAGGADNTPLFRFDKGDGAPLWQGSFDGSSFNLPLGAPTKLQPSGGVTIEGTAGFGSGLRLSNSASDLPERAWQLGTGWHAAYDGWLLFKRSDQAAWTCAISDTSMILASGKSIGMYSTAFLTSQDLGSNYAIQLASTGSGASAKQIFRNNGQGWEWQSAGPTVKASLSTAGDLATTRSLKPGSHSVSALPSASALGAGAMIFVSDESGGATMAFSDGANWRRMSDRAVVS